MATGLKLPLACQIAMPLAMSIRPTIGPIGEHQTAGIAQQILAPGQFQFDPVIALIGEFEAEPAGVAVAGERARGFAGVEPGEGGVVITGTHRGEGARRTIVYFVQEGARALKKSLSRANAIGDQNNDCPASAANHLQPGPSPPLRAEEFSQPSSPNASHGQALRTPDHLQHAPRQPVDRALQDHRSGMAVDRGGAFGAAHVLPDHRGFGGRG